MRLPMYLAIIYHLISVTGAPLNFIYEVIPDKKTNTKYKGTTTLVTHNRSTLTAVECAGICEEATGCGGFNYCEISAGYRTCEAVEANKEPIDPTELRWFKGCFYFHKSTVSFNLGSVFHPLKCSLLFQLLLSQHLIGSPYIFSSASN